MLSRTWSLVALAIAGLVVTGVAVGRWAPETTLSLPEPARVTQQAQVDAEALGFQLAKVRRPGLTAGPRYHSMGADVHVLRERVEDPAERRRLLALVPPVRMSVRSWEAVGSDGSPGALLLEYDGDARLVGASFGWDGVVKAGMQPYAGPEFAEAAAALLLGEPPPDPEIVRMGGGIEYVYDLGPGRPGAYVYLGGSARWIAALQPAPYPLLTREFTFVQREVVSQVAFYLIIALALLLVGSLLWRLSARRAGFGHTRLLGAILLLGLLPALPHLPAGLTLVNFLVVYVVVVGLILLAWSVAEAELREIRPASVEHWDRLVRRQPVRETGWALLIGVAFGAGLAGLGAAGGRLAEFVGGGYSGLLLVLPEYWMLPTPLTWGLALAACIAFLTSFGRRLGGHPGAIAGAALGGVAWSLAVPVAPQWCAVALGVAASLAVGWLMARYGLLALATACVTALSLPTALILGAAWPLRWDSFLAACLPLALAVLGLVLVRRAPRFGSLESVQPDYVSELEQHARLTGEVELLRQFQLSLLPAADASLELAQCDVAWRMIPADTVGGDFLDLVEDEAGRLWIAIADAAGHGISCSVLTAFTKAAVAEHVSAEASPAQALAGIRRLFGRLRTRRSMVTLLLAVWDRAERTLTVANAGHPPLLVHDAGVREIGFSSNPLGTALEDAPNEEDTVRLGERAVVVGYTDGAPEAAAPSGETFGYDRWAASLPELAQGEASATDILAHLLNDVERHRSGRPADDDVTAVVLRLG